MTHLIQKVFIVALTLCTIHSSTALGQSKLINGAGATFPFPIYTKWFSDYKKANPKYSINYQSIGSGGGIRQLLDGTVDFGASDAPMTDDQMKASTKGPILHFPTVLGAVVMIYNVPEIKIQLRLTPDLIAEIFSGKITKWNDPKLVAANPKISLPATLILPVYRSDGSGTTAVFTDYLAKTNAEWKKNIGQGTAIKWPVGIGGKGNEGVTGVVKQSKGTIGYVELIYAKTNNLSYALLKNKAGEFIEASPDAVTAAADASLKTMPADFRTSITDAEGKKSYPISSYTYLLVYKEMPKDAGTGITEFIKWAMGSGQKMAKELYYAPLPKSVADKVIAAVKTISLK